MGTYACRQPSAVLSEAKEPFRQRLHATPKAELHLHLRGAMPPEFFGRLVAKHPVESVLPTIPERQLAFYRRFDNLRSFLSAPAIGPQEISELFTYSSFEAFLGAYGLTGRFFQTPDDLAGLIDAVAHGLAEQTVTYAEVTASVNEYVVNTPLTLDEVVEGLERGCEASRETRLRWIVDLVRGFGPTQGYELLEEILQRSPRHLVGITVGGSEDAYPTSQFAPVYNLARDNGLGLSIHAGEWLGAESVWEAVNTLSPDRIGHGVRAIGDPELVRHLAEQQTPLEISMTSNLRTGVYGNYDEHPIRRLYESDVPITINTDDPTFFGTSLVDEYARLGPLGFSDREILGLVENGFAYAFDA